MTNLRKLVHNGQKDSHTLRSQVLSNEIQSNLRPGMLEVSEMLELTNWGQLDVFFFAPVEQAWTYSCTS